MFLRQRGDHPLAFFFDFLGEAGMLLFDETGGHAQFQQRDREDCRKIIKIRADLGQLHGLDGLVIQLLHCIVQLAFEQWWGTHCSVIGK